MNSKLLLSILFLKILLVLVPPVFASSPIESMRIGPLPFNAATGVRVETEIATDRPHATLEYRWFINGEEEFFEKSEHLPGYLLKRGDQVFVEVTPVAYSGESLEPLVSPPFVAVNAPPVFTSEPPEAISEAGFIYQVTASDPDGDNLTYQLESGPDDMTIDAATGLLEWHFEVMPEGSFTVTIIVEDGFGGSVEQQFELQLAFEEVRPQ